MSINLNKINLEELKKFDIYKLNQLASQIKEFLIESNSKTGGHIGANLSSLEILIALHKVFESPKDKFIFDVGHQAYVHKILTGRSEKFTSLNSYMGMARFVEQRESDHDITDVSHAGTSIPIASGIAKANYDNKIKNYSLAIIGDGCMVEGMSFEGLNYSVKEKIPLIIIFIDNGWAIAPNVGGILNLTSGNNWENKSRNFFEGLGYNYVSEPSGHDIEKLINKLEKVKSLNGPTVFHLKTIKGRGLPMAEKHPYRMHYASPYDLNSGKGGNPTVTGKTFAGEAADVIYQKMKKDKNIYVITPATPYSNNLDDIIKDFPDRGFDVGMAEQQAVGMSVGLALEGKKVIVCFQSTFMQRAFDQIYHDACCMNLPITFLSSRTGFAGYDSPTHHGLMDIPYLRCIPNLQLYFPGDSHDLKECLKQRMENPKGPMVILHQYDPINEPEYLIQNYNDSGISQIEKGKDGAILTLGNYISRALEVKKKLHEKYRKDFSIHILRRIKPVDQSAIKNILLEYNYIASIEEGTLMGGLGSILLEEKNRVGANCNFIGIGVEDKFINAGNSQECSKEAGIDSDTATQKIVNGFKFA